MPISGLPSVIVCPLAERIRRVFDTKPQTRQPLPQGMPLPSPPTALPVPSAQTLTTDYLAMVFETFLDTVFPFQGFLLIDSQGHLIQSSPYARQLGLGRESDGGSGRSPAVAPASPAAVTPLATAVNHLVQCLIESRQLFPGEHIQLRDEVIFPDQMRVSLEAEWVDLHCHSCIVVTLENRTAGAQQQAAIDGRRYHLTERETEVWQYALLGLSYSEIAQALFISINTVKQHMKRIYQKQEG